MPQVKRRAKSKAQPKPPEVDNDRDEEDEDEDDFDEDEDNGQDENGEDENGNDEPQQQRQRGDLKLEISDDKVTVELSRTGNEANVLSHVADLLEDLT